MLGAANDKPLRNRWPVLSFLEVKQPNGEVDAAQQQTGITLHGWIHRYLMFERGAIWTPEGDFKLRNVEVKQQVTFLVSAEAILIKREDTPWQIAVEML
ncbi:hypothetical protein [Pseudomonas sp. NPDC087614]|uniref:hypothetical protein n=1 Tax=Pseudomonas sp. NPDC087614 TaxID=3364442 RepID=UPI00382F3511